MLKTFVGLQLVVCVSIANATAREVVEAVSKQDFTPLTGVGFGPANRFTKSALEVESKGSDVAPEPEQTARDRNDRPPFRSAFLQRAFPERYSSPTSTLESVRQLQSHFDAVIQYLERHTNSSLAIAMKRLEMHRRVGWSASQRDVVEAELRSARQWQIEQLRRYRDRGRFPQNEGHAPHAVPIFVDRQNTACAVAYLMRHSGHKAVVQDVVRSDNLVLITEADSGPLIEWISESGLTQEEAALIQPAYGWPAPQALIGELGQGEAALERSGIRVENFAASVANFEASYDNFPIDFDPDFCAENPDLCREICDNMILPCEGRLDVGDPIANAPGPDTDQIGIAIGDDDFDAGYGVSFGPEGTHYLSFGTAVDFDNTNFVDGRSEPGVLQRISFAFDVSTSEPGQVIDQIGADHDASFLGFFTGTEEDHFRLTVTGQVEQETVAEATFNEITNPFPGGQVALAAFEGKQSLSVNVVVDLFGDVSVSHFWLDFRVVPAPLTADFDKDGDVDGDDFLTWQANFGQTGNATQRDGDADGDADVDGDDFLAWQVEFGSGVGGRGSGTPEPATVALVIGSVVIGLARRSRS